jgi:hypothetical protein
MGFIRDDFMWDSQIFCDGIETHKGHMKKYPLGWACPNYECFMWLPINDKCMKDIGIKTSNVEEVVKSLLELMYKY